MKILYIECNMGAAGDMLMAALSELCYNSDDFIEKINKIGIPKTKISKEEVFSCGIKGTHISVEVNGIKEYEHNHNYHSHEHNINHHTHRGLCEIEKIINELNISEKVKKDANSVYRIIAEAEGYVHGKNVSEIHFHEVGTFDAICDIVGVCILMEEISPDKIIVSPINTGNGQVKCAHGILPVPAPATEYILRGIPYYKGDIKSELCTPTGAALLKYFADEFSEMPVIKVENTGYGMGTKQFDTANCVRTFLGNTKEKENVIQLSTNIDDMTGEEIAFASEKLMKMGFLDVYTENIFMKKGRPAVIFNILVKDSQREEAVKSLFKYTTTIGIREYGVKRYTLDRYEKVVDTDYGKIKCKISEGYGVRRIKAEYDDLAEIAEKNNISIKNIKIDFENME